LRLPGIKLMWAKLAEQSDKEGWPAARFLAALAEHEMADRGRRRIERHLAEARLPAGKTLATFDFEAVPMVSKAQVMALARDQVDTAAHLRRADAMLIVGSSLMVYSGYRFVQMAVRAGLPIAAVNLGRTRADDLLALKLEQACEIALAFLL
jgi:IstB-like ATP binding protein